MGAGIIDCHCVQCSLVTDTLQPCCNSSVHCSTGPQQNVDDDYCACRPRQCRVKAVGVTGYSYIWAPDIFRTGAPLGVNQALDWSTREIVTMLKVSESAMLTSRVSQCRVSLTKTSSFDGRRWKANSTLMQWRSWSTWWDTAGSRWCANSAVHTQQTSAAKYSKYLTHQSNRSKGVASNHSQRWWTSMLLLA